MAGYNEIEFKLALKASETSPLGLSRYRRKAKAEAKEEIMMH